MTECQSCGGFVTDDYARVFGDNDDNVFDCRSCRSRSRRADEDDDDGRVVLLREVRGEDGSSGTGRIETADGDTPTGGNDEGSGSGLSGLLSSLRR